MRSFRFTGWMLILMITSLVGVLIAIEQARTLSIGLSADSGNVPTGWGHLPAVFLAVLVFTAVAGVIGYALLLALRRSGIQRLSSAEILRRRNN